MPARIFCKVGELKGVMKNFTDELVVGRSSQCSLHLNVPMVSGRHARISWHRDAGVYVLEDLGSTNGTALDGITVRESEPLGHLHVITLAGTYDFIFQDLDRCAGRHAGAGGKRVKEPEEEPLEMKTMVQDAIPSLPSMIAPLPRAEDPAQRTQVDLQMPFLPGSLGPRREESDPASDDDKPSLDKTLRGFNLMQLPDFLQAPPATPSSGLPVIAADTVDLDEVASDLDEVASDLVEPKEVGIPVSQSNVERLMLGEPIPTDQPLELEVMLNDGARRYPLPEGRTLFGRGTEATLQVDSLEVSRLHAELLVEKGRVRIRDLGSRNHTFVNDVQTEGTVEIPADAELRFGNLVARLVVTSSTEA